MYKIDTIFDIAEDTGLELEVITGGTFPDFVNIEYASGDTGSVNIDVDQLPLLIKTLGDIYIKYSGKGL